MKTAIHLTFATVLCACAEPARAQTAPQNYGNYYNRNAVQGTRTNVNAFLFDKYFYRDTAVSPYANLGRRGGMGGDSYSTLVAPELQRRRQADASMRTYVQQRKMAGNVGHTVYSNKTGQLSPRPQARRAGTTPNTNPYYNQWYGGRR